MPIATATDGTHVAYRIDGHGAPPILKAHGLVSSVEHWPYFDAHYGRSHQLLSWEYRGHGEHPEPADARTISVAQFADDAYAVWRAAGTPPAIVVGLSFGVQVALEIWRRHPDCVHAIVLICGTAGHPLDRVSSSPLLRRAALELVRGVRPLTPPLLALLRSRAGSWIARETAFATGGAHRETCPREVLDHLFAHVGSLAPDVVAAAVTTYLEHSAWDVLPTITVPTLIIAGDRDQLTPVATAERMRHAIPNAQLVVFPGHSHLVQVERPDAVHAAIDQFIRTVCTEASRS